ncbi:hypothetical protein W97_04878 [Coniosporium apollinis CBS 100218]|uniref:NAD(P)-binding domain-containing protein n=1 Tax=Coniosporium apollinis (strain CBS 100218) TaxID=1168221 RepID=R7YV25_CONA1|nr:uncharacterized protein W97_04878 [Coniosporium apollinis CBS 100218]EON65639.1 hypothetical protein W97_04878 [Coniosporium apollinis CBS 100218]
MVKIFATGTTGYIGGDALHRIAQAHPEYRWTCLVRSKERGAHIADQYPDIELVYGTLDDAHILTDQTAKADIVLHFADADHPDAAKAILAGLDADNRTRYLIHTSGTGELLWRDLDAKRFGQADDKIYDDWDGIADVTSIPERAPHRNVDKLILDAGLKTAIVSPPTIYGLGRGPGNQRGHQIYELSRCTLEQKHGIMVGEGQTYWPNVHVYDLSDLYLRLVEEAARDVGSATWGAQGYYFAVSGEHVWGAVAKNIAAAAKKQGLISTDEVVSVSPEEANGLTRWGSALWGANSRAQAIRARKVLGWDPKQISLEEEIPKAVAQEAERMGLA